jgi:DNA-binding transcriptional MerR regulator
MSTQKQIAFDFDAPDALPVAIPAPVEAAMVNEDAAPVLIIADKADDAVIDVDFNAPAITPAVVIAKRKKLHNKKSTRGRLSLKDAEAGADLIEIPEDDILFQKLYYSIGTVADMFKVNQSLIRFWENEFDILKPRKNGKGDRLFRPEDVKNLKLIYNLLRERKYTIEGAKDFLKNSKRADEKFAMIESLKKIKGFLLELKANL